MSRDGGIPGALEDLWQAITLLRVTAAELPVNQRHLFLQAVGRLGAVAEEVALLFEPIDV